MANVLAQQPAASAERGYLFYPQWKTILLRAKSFVFLLHDPSNEEKMHKLFDMYTSPGKRKATPEPLVSPSGLCLTAHRTLIQKGHGCIDQEVGPDGLNLGAKHNIQLVAIKRDDKMDVHPGPKEVIKAGDELFYACAMCQGLFHRNLHDAALTRGITCHCVLLDTEETQKDTTSLPMDYCIWPEELDRATFGDKLVPGATTAIAMRQTNGCRLVGVNTYYPVQE